MADVLEAFPPCLVRTPLPLLWGGVAAKSKARLKPKPHVSTARRVDAREKLPRNSCQLHSLSRCSDHVVFSGPRLRPPLLAWTQFFPLGLALNRRDFSRTRDHQIRTIPDGHPEDRPAAGFQGRHDLRFNLIAFGRTPVQRHYSPARSARSTIRLPHCRQQLAYERPPLNSRRILRLLPSCLIESGSLWPPVGRPHKSQKFTKIKFSCRAWTARAHSFAPRATASSVCAS